MSQATLDGTTLAVSAGIPATYVQADYAGLTWTDDSCSLTEVPALSRTWTAVTNNRICKTEQEDKKGSAKYDNVTFTLVKDDANPAQVILVAGEADKNVYAFKLTFPEGEIAYFSGQVGKFAYTDGGGLDTMNTKACEIFISAGSLVSA